MEDAWSDEDKHPTQALDKGIRALDLSNNDPKIKKDLDHLARRLIHVAQGSGSWGSEEGKQAFIRYAEQYTQKG